MLGIPWGDSGVYIRSDFLIGPLNGEVFCDSGALSVSPAMCHAYRGESGSAYNVCLVF